MTNTLRILIAASMLGACYVHPAPVDGGPRDGGARDGRAPIDAPAADAASLDGEIPARDATADAASPVACETDDDCQAEPCSIALCDEGECMAMPAAAGTACDDEDLCTTNDRCSDEACTGTPLTCAACGIDATLTTLPARWAKNVEAMLPHADGDVTLTGFDDGNLWLAAIGRDGSVVFDHELGHASGGDSGFVIARDATGRTIVGGYSQVDGGPALPWLIEVDDEGDLLAPHVPFGTRTGVVQGLAPLPGGGLVVLASIEGRATLARLSPTFAIEWERTYFDVGWAYGLADVIALPGGDLVFAGDMGSFPAASVRVVRVRPTGEVVWERSLVADAVGAILARPDGTFVVVGQRRTAGSGAAWLARLDAAGIAISEHVYGADPNGSIQAVSAAPDGSLVLAAAEGSDAWIVRVAANGTRLEDATISLGAHERADAVRVLADGTIVVAGTSEQAGVEGPRHAWLARATSIAGLACAH